MGIGDNIRKLRKVNGLTREELSRKSGVIYRTIENIEKGKTENPGIIIINKIAKTLGVSVDALLYEGGKSGLTITIPPEILKILNKEKTIYLLNLLKEAEISDLKKVLNFLISLSQGKNK